MAKIDAGSVVGVLDPTYARVLVKRAKQLPCPPEERRWFAHEALVAGRTATLFHRNGLHEGLVHFVEGRKRVAMAAGGVMADAAGVSAAACEKEN